MARSSLYDRSITFLANGLKASSITTGHALALQLSRYGNVIRLPLRQRLHNAHTKCTELRPKVKGEHCCLLAQAARMPVHTATAAAATAADAHAVSRCSRLQ
jgi:hypothetical protein